VQTGQALPIRCLSFTLPHPDKESLSFFLDLHLVFPGKENRPDADFFHGW
jgi:hypothetical protein